MNNPYEIKDFIEISEDEFDDYIHNNRNFTRQRWGDGFSYHRQNNDCIGLLLSNGKAYTKTKYWEIS